jgi:geranylgeranyl diphosphate synthase type II
MPAPVRAVDAAAYLARARERVDAYLDEVLPRAGTGPGRLHEAMRYSVFAGGKRVRPALALASSEAVGGSVEDALPVAAALEMVHTYSLVHDDLPCMDDDDLRRGKPTSHRVFGEALAVLAGDALHSLAFESLLSGGPAGESGCALARDLASAAGVRGMVGGQVEDLEAEGRPPSEERLARIHAGKTAALFAAACRAGGRAGGADREAVSALDRFGRDLGLAFQVVDDVLDETGTAESLGKTPGKDKRGRKMTYVSLEGASAARERAKRLCESAVGALGPVRDPSVLTALARHLLARDR